jgi:hypothetical protein
MRYQVVSRKALHKKNRYIVDLDLSDSETLNKSELLKELDAPFGAPLGGDVDLLPNGLLQVDVYTD